MNYIFKQYCPEILITLDILYTEVFLLLKHEPLKLFLSSVFEIYISLQMTLFFIIAVNFL